MSGATKDSDDSWVKFLNPETLRANLVSASLFIASYEYFKGCVVDRARSFFTSGFDGSGFLSSEEYKTEVLSLSKHGQLHATLLWFKRMEAINDADVENFERIREYRNEVVHKLQGYLTESRRQLDTNKFDDLLSLLMKIEKWWFINVEVAIDPDILPEEADPENVAPGSVLSIQLMHDIALGREPEPGYYYNAVAERCDNV